MTKARELLYEYQTKEYSKLLFNELDPLVQHHTLSNVLIALGKVCKARADKLSKEGQHTHAKPWMDQFYAITKLAIKTSL